MFLAAFVAVFLLKETSVAAPPALLYQPGTELLTGDRDLPDPLFPYRDEEKPELAKAAEIKETEGCKSLQSWEPTIVSHDHWQTVSQIYGPSFSQVGILAVNAATNCIKVGTPAQIVELNPGSGLTSLLGWFMPTGIAKPRTEYKKQEDLILISAGLFGTTGPVNFVSGRVIISTRSRRIENYAPRLNGARFITRDQMEAAIKDGAQIVDVRSKKQFDTVHIKGSVHVPYTTGPRMSVLDDYSKFAKAGDAFDIRKINADREKPVILVGEEPEADGVYRAAVVLRSEGWKKIFIFYEGFNFFAGMVSAPPRGTIFFTEIGDSDQLLGIRSDKALGAQIVDVRSAGEFAQGAIPKSISVPYKERDDLRMRRPRLNGDMLIDYGDTWQPPATLSKTIPIIIVGEHLQDWRAYKAGLIANAMGFKAIYRYNPGMKNWRFLSTQDPIIFPIAVAGNTGVNK